LNNPYDWLADVITRRPFAVACVVFAVIFVALIGMSFVTMETGTDTYLDKNTERGMILDSYTKSFSSDAIMLLVEADDVTNPDTLRYIDHLQTDISNERYVSGVTSIVDQMKTVNGGELPTSAADISRVKEYIPAELIEMYLPSNLMTISVITLQPGVSSEVTSSLIDSIESIILISGPPPGVQVTVTGSPAFQKQMQEEMGTSMGMLIGAAMLLMVIAVGLLFSHVRYRFLPVVIVACGLIFTFGFMGLAGIPISMVVIGAFPVLIGIGIDYAIQFQSRFDEEVRRSTINEAVHTTLKNSGPSILFAMISTSLGFIAMFVSPVPMVGDFGFTCVIGVASCYLAALIIVPTFALLVDYKPKELNNGTLSGFMDRYDSLLGGLAARISKHAVPVILILGLIAVIGIQLDTRVPISTDEETFVPSDMPAVIDLNKVSRIMGSTQTLPIYIRGPDITSAETLSWIRDFSAYEISNNDKITGATSIVTYLEAYNNGVLPTTDAEIDAVLETIPEEIRDRYLSGNMATVLQFSLVDMESEVALSLVDRVRDDIAWQEMPPELSVVPTGQLEMFTALIGDIKTGKVVMTFLGFGLIFAFLLVLYRKISAIAPIIPIIMIVGWNGAIMYTMGIDYNPMTAVLGSMTIGVASEYTILIMERFDEERRKGQDVVSAIRQSVQKIGTAITVSGLTTVFGFSALLLSTFNIIKNFGLVTVITVGFSLIGAIVVMPAVLTVISHIAEMRKTRRPVP
jgi:hydrophobe/amphiphile efflux-3 (HAE3) family protein